FYPLTHAWSTALGPSTPALQSVYAAFYQGGLVTENLHSRKMVQPKKFRGVRQRHWGSWVSEIRHPLL
ncbi:hypothetical protein ACJX0J_024947, partial [Zea mays]